MVFLAYYTFQPLCFLWLSFITSLILSFDLVWLLFTSFVIFHFCSVSSCQFFRFQFLQLQIVNRTWDNINILKNLNENCWKFLKIFSWIYQMFFPNIENQSSAELMPGPQNVWYFRFLKKWLFKEKTASVQHFCLRNMTDLVI